MNRPTTVVHLLRHGEVHNPDGVLYGCLPGYHLSAEGRAMADAAARALVGRDVVVVRSSPLERAQETAEPVATTLGLEVEPDGRLVESHNVFQGMRFGVGDGALRNPRAWLYLHNPFAPSWGEHYTEVVARMMAAVHDARIRALGREAVLVSHQLPIWVTRRAVEGRPLWHRPDRRQCGLASLTSLTFRGSEATSVTYTEPAGAAARKRAVPGA